MFNIANSMLDIFLKISKSTIASKSIFLALKKALSSLALFSLSVIQFIKPVILLLVAKDASIGELKIKAFRY